MAGTWEFAGYAARSYSIAHQADSGSYTAQFLLILLASLWVNAFVYMILGRMIHFFLADDRICGIRARRVTLMFVLFDITAFVVQLGGGLMSSGDEYSIETIKLGLKIYTGGVGLQLAFITVFCLVAFRFRQLMLKQDRAYSLGVSLEPITPVVAAGEYHSIDSFIACKIAQPPTINYLSRTWSQATPLFIALAIALALVIVRNIYRLIEYGMGGVDGNVMTRNEWFQYVFDALLMLAAMVVLNIEHPGKTLQGERSVFKSEDKVQKVQKKQAKAVKKAVKKAAEAGRREKKVDQEV